MDSLTLLTAEQRAFWELDLLWRPRKAQVAFQYGKPASVPKHGGNQVNWRRLEALSLATNPITEGVPPVAVSDTVTTITATASQYGNVQTITDNLFRMGVDDLFAEMSVNLAQNAGESVEQLVFNVIEGGTNVIYPGAFASKACVTASNPISLSLVRGAVAQLDAQNTPKWGGDMENTRAGVGKYIGLMHPNMMYDLISDTEIKNAFQYRDTAAFYQGEVAMTYNVDWYITTLAPVYTGAGAAGINLYGALIFGRDAFGVIDIDGSGKFEMVVNDFGSSGVYDPLHQLASIGWKAYQAPTILNNNFLTQIIASSNAPGA